MNTKLGFRKLKEQQSRKKIDHPLSKYNNLGQVTCIVCNLPLKNDLLWEPHLLSRKHKEAVAALKLQATSSKGNAKNLSTVPKESNTGPAKKRKNEESFSTPTSQPAQKIIKEDLKAVSRSDDSIHNVLPADFFDNTHSETNGKKENASIIVKESSSPSQRKTSTSSANLSDKLPEGFFDDAKMDAKVRKVEYVDKKEEEWEEFQKMIAEETKVSENLQAEEEDEIKVERDLAEYGALKQYLTRVDKLKEKRDTHKTVITNNKDECEDDGNASDGSDDELDDILNWRAKKA